MSIRADRQQRRVVWTMTPDDARDLARLIHWNDGAHKDADALDAAADALDSPDYDAPGIRIVIVDTRDEASS